MTQNKSKAIYPNKIVRLSEFETGGNNIDAALSKVKEELLLPGEESIHPNTKFAIMTSLQNNGFLLELSRKPETHGCEEASMNRLRFKSGIVGKGINLERELKTILATGVIKTTNKEILVYITVNIPAHLDIKRADNNNKRFDKEYITKLLSGNVAKFEVDTKILTWDFDMGIKHDVARNLGLELGTINPISVIQKTTEKGVFALHIFDTEFQSGKYYTNDGTRTGTMAFDIDKLKETVEKITKKIPIDGYLPPLIIAPVSQPAQTRKVGFGIS